MSYGVAAVFRSIKEMVGEDTPDVYASWYATLDHLRATLEHVDAEIRANPSNVPNLMHVSRRIHQMILQLVKLQEMVTVAYLTSRTK